MAFKAYRRKFTVVSIGQPSSHVSKARRTSCIGFSRLCLQGQNGTHFCVSNSFTLSRTFPFFYLCTCTFFIIIVQFFSYNTLAILINRYSNVFLNRLVIEKWLGGDSVTPLTKIGPLNNREGLNPLPTNDAYMRHWSVKG